jgi:hypothetical protein
MFHDKCIDGLTKINFSPHAFRFLPLWNDSMNFSELMSGLQVVDMRQSLKFPLRGL